MDRTNLLLLGASGLIGQALQRKLNDDGRFKILAPPSQELDLKNSSAVSDYFQTHRPTLVINAAGKSGGILANKKMPADFILDNNLMQINVLHSSLQSKVQKYLQFIPACVYPTTAPLPYSEDSILSGPLEESSQYFAVAKINALMMAQAFNRQHGTQFISIVPSNIYGPSSKAANENSHVIPSLIRKMKEARLSDSSLVEIWGSGKNQRDFLHVDDLADATLTILSKSPPADIINVGSGKLTSVSELSDLIKLLTNYTGKFEFKDNGLAGAQDKYVDCGKILSMGWRPQVSLQDGLKSLL